MSITVTIEKQYESDIEAFYISQRRIYKGKRNVYSEIDIK